MEMPPMNQHRSSQFQGMQMETRARKIVEQLGGTWSRSRGRVRQGGVISAVAVGHRQAALAVMCRG